LLIVFELGSIGRTVLRCNCAQTACSVSVSQVGSRFLCDSIGRFLCYFCFLLSSYKRKWSQATTEGAELLSRHDEKRLKLEAGERADIAAGATFNNSVILNCP
jgi:hypothetical protein